MFNITDAAKCFPPQLLLNSYYSRLKIGATNIHSVAVTAKNMDVERVELVGTDSFEPVGGFDFNNGTLAIKMTKDYLDGEVKLDTSATLRLYPVGYETPIEKAITIKTVTTKPSLSLTPASSTINTKLQRHLMGKRAHNLRSGHCLRQLLCPHHQ